MANDLNNADKLIERIMSDAREEADRMSAETQTALDRIEELFEHDKWELDMDTAEKTKKLSAGISERSRTNAQLDSRKYALRERRTVIDEAFAAASDKLYGLKGAERDSLIKAVAVREADGGETLRPAKADAEILGGRLLGDINAALKAAGKAPVTLGEVSDIRAGFILVGAGYEKDCSFAAMLREVREREESSVAGILFK